MDNREVTKARACTECSSAGGLPPEVWANIRGFMHMKEWARVSGTCRCMWNLPLSAVDISPPIRAEGVDWAAKRWRSAHQLVMKGNKGLLQAMVQKLHPGCTDLASVQTLLVDTSIGQEDCERCPQYMASLFYLLAHLTGLRTLNLQIHSMQSLPPLSGLKELSLKYNTTKGAPGVELNPHSLRSLFGCLKEMSGLELVSLDASPMSDDPLWMDQWAPILDLAMLPKLTLVCVDSFAPEGVVLPPACALDLRLLGPVKWGMCRLVQQNLCIFSLQNQHMIVDVVPDAFRHNLPKLESVTFSVMKIGGICAHLSLSHALMHVKSLQLVAAAIWLQIPAGVTWEDIRIEAFEVLSIKFEDVAAFVRTVRKCQISYFYASGPFLADLACEVARQGLHWKATQFGVSTTIDVNAVDRGPFSPMCPIYVTCFM